MAGARTLRFHGIGEQAFHVRAVSQVNGKLSIIVDSVQTSAFLQQIPARTGNEYIHQTMTSAFHKVV